MRNRIVAAVALAALPFTTLANDIKIMAGAVPAGILAKSNREALPTLTPTAGQPVAKEPLRLKSGKFHTLEIEADGSQELALQGAGFFRAIWVNEIVIEGIEIRPFSVASIEFDEGGEAEISFVAVKTGGYRLAVPGSNGDTQQVTTTIE